MTPMNSEQSNTEVVDAFSPDEREALLYACRVAFDALDDGFAFPRDQNRIILEAARSKLERGHALSPGRSQGGVAHES